MKYYERSCDYYGQGTRGPNWSWFKRVSPRHLPNNNVVFPTYPRVADDESDTVSPDELEPEPWRFIPIFSSLAALKSISRCDCDCSRPAEAGVVISLASLSIIICKLVPAGTDLEKNFGIGRADGAGEVWKVGPAYAFEGGVEDNLGGVI